MRVPVLLCSGSSNPATATAMSQASERDIGIPRQSAATSQERETAYSCWEEQVPNIDDTAWMDGALIVPPGRQRRVDPVPSYARWLSSHLAASSPADGDGIDGGEATNAADSDSTTPPEYGGLRLQGVAEVLTHQVWIQSEPRNETMKLATQPFTEFNGDEDATKHAAASHVGAGVDLAETAKEVAVKRLRRPHFDGGRLQASLSAVHGSALVAFGGLCVSKGGASKRGQSQLKFCGSEDGCGEPLVVCTWLREGSGRRKRGGPHNRTVLSVDEATGPRIATQPRFGHAAVFVGDHLYVYGGSSQSCTATSDFFRLDLKPLQSCGNDNNASDVPAEIKLRATNLASAQGPGPRTGHIMACVGSKIYLLGGHAEKVTLPSLRKPAESRFNLWHEPLHQWQRRQRRMTGQDLWVFSVEDSTWHCLCNVIDPLLAEASHASQLSLQVSSCLLLPPTPRRTKGPDTHQQSLSDVDEPSKAVKPRLVVTMVHKAGYGYASGDNVGIYVFDEDEECWRAQKRLFGCGQKNLIAFLARTQSPGMLCCLLLSTRCHRCCLCGGRCGVI